MFKECLLIFSGISFGLLSSAGVFTVFSAVGLVPRFAGKTHSAKRIFLYENMIILGTVIGGAFSLWPEYWKRMMSSLTIRLGRLETVNILQNLSLVVIGLFSGMFVGCLALSIAEMLDSIPIFARRVSLKKGVGLAICSVAAGKIFGAMFYFMQELSGGS